MSYDMDKKVCTCDDCGDTRPVGNMADVGEWGNLSFRRSGETTTYKDFCPKCVKGILYFHTK